MVASLGSCCWWHRIPVDSVSGWNRYFPRGKVLWTPPSSSQRQPVLSRRSINSELNYCNSPNARINRRIKNRVERTLQWNRASTCQHHCIPVGRAGCGCFARRVTARIAVRSLLIRSTNGRIRRKRPGRQLTTPRTTDRHSRGLPPQPQPPPQLGRVTPWAAPAESVRWQRRCVIYDLFSRRCFHRPL